jgi:hypothetical protein
MPSPARCKLPHDRQGAERRLCPARGEVQSLRRISLVSLRAIRRAPTTPLRALQRDETRRPKAASALPQGDVREAGRRASEASEIQLSAARTKAEEITVELGGIAYRGTYSVEHKMVHGQSPLATRLRHLAVGRSRYLHGCCYLNLHELPKARITLRKIGRPNRVRFGAVSCEAQLSRKR